jgi:hypothetical protein
MERRTVVNLWGGVGNQLYRLAAGISVADRIGASELLAGQMSTDLTLLRTLTAMEPRKTTWLEETMSGGVATPVRSSHLLQSVLSKSLFSRAVIKGANAWTPMPARLPRGRYCYVQGPCEHPSYYEDSIESILQAIHTSAGERLSNLSQNSASIVVNVRRGDFLTLNWVLSLDYYVRALSHLQTLGHLTSERVAVVGDDKWACIGLSELLKRHFPDVEFAVDDGSDALADFAVMAHAKHLILSNSTFAWWARKYGQFEHQGSSTIFPGSEVARGNPNADVTWTCI